MNNMLVNVQLHMSRKLRFLYVLMSEIRFFYCFFRDVSLTPPVALHLCVRARLCACAEFSIALVLIKHTDPVKPRQGNMTNHYLCMIYTDWSFEVGWVSQLPPTRAK